MTRECSEYHSAYLIVYELKILNTYFIPIIIRANTTVCPEKYRSYDTI